MALVMVVGGGSREHALVDWMASEGHRVLCAPGNAGTQAVARNIDARTDDVPGLVAVAKRERVDLVVVGPEGPLVLGVVDALEALGVRAFGPRRAAAELEGSKAFMKRFLERHGIATATFEVFDEAEAAEDYVRQADCPLVVKTDGLAAGKGVVVAQDTERALAAVGAAMRDRVFGDAGRRVVIEELLPGQEASFHVITDGERWLTLPAAQDHKRLLDRDKGPNTGGMGAYAPAKLVTPAIARAIEEDVIAPTLRGMRAEGAPFRGVLFAGLMIHKGKASVLEFNVRFGDPEACVLVPLIDGSLYELLYAAASGALPPNVGVRDAHALAVVMASQGYPQKPVTGDVIEGLDESGSGARVYHAGTRRTHQDGTDCVVTNGGRVLTVTATGPTLAAAHDAAYATVARIRFRGEQHRTDIGSLALHATS